MLSVWAVLYIGGAFYAAHFSYRQRPFAATLITFGFYFAAMLLFAAPGATDFVSSRLGSGSGYLLGVTTILGYLIYAFGTNSFTFARGAAVTAFVFVDLRVCALRLHRQHEHGLPELDT